MRLIDADELMKEIEKIRDMARYARANLVRFDVIGHVLKAVTEAPTVDAERDPKWISVKDRLPKEGIKKFLVAFEISGERIMDMARLVDGVFVLSSWTVPQGTITHWMPLPEPPEKKNGGANNA